MPQERISRGSVMRTTALAALLIGCGPGKGSRPDASPSGAGGATGSDGGPPEIFGSSTGGDAGRDPGTPDAARNDGSIRDATDATDATDARAAGVPQLDHVYIIMMENRSDSSVIGTATYLTELANQYTHATAYNTTLHPSLPNYIALTSGGAQGIDCDCQPTGTSACAPTLCVLLSNCNCSKAVMHIGDQLDAAQIEWRSYGEDMGAATPCNTNETSTYKTKHVPFLYYQNVQGPTAATGRCAKRVRDYTDFTQTDRAARTYRYTMITPNMCNDMHDSCAPMNNPVQQGDAWLAKNVPPIISVLGPRDVLFIVFDEQDNSTGTGPIPFVAVGPLVKLHAAPNDAMNHYSLLATIQDGLGLGRLPGQTAAPPITSIWR